MRKFWYRRILIMILVLSVSVGGSSVCYSYNRVIWNVKLLLNRQKPWNPRRNAGGNLSGDRWGYGAWNRGGRR